METGVGASKRERRKGIKTLIRTKKPGDGRPAEADEVREAAIELMDEDEYEHELQKLRDRGDVYQPGGPGTLDIT